MIPATSFGLGLRPRHYHEILDGQPRIDWFEIISENYLVDGGKPLHFLERIRARYPVVMHGVSLSIGSTDPLNTTYLRDLKALAERIEPAWISDHLCWTGTGGHNMHDLLPFPYTAEALQHVAGRIREVQEFLGRQILIENPSTYVSFRSSEMPEWEFLGELVERADCLILLDVNNVYVSATNHGFDPWAYLSAVPGDRVRQIHLAGGRDVNGLIVDTHDEPVPDPVWQLYERVIRRIGPVATMIERDDAIPPLAEMEAELDSARAAMRRATGT